MEIQQSLLVLCGKSPIYNDLARSFRNSKNLKVSDGEEIEISLQSEIPESSNHAFRVESYMDALSTDCFCRFLLWSPRLASTHDIVSQNFCDLPIGSVSVADVQFKGRGRSKNVWESPIGCLLFSFTIQMEDGRAVPLLQYVVSLAVTEAIKMVCEAKGLPHLDVKIKWPNDLYLDGLKVGGILCTSTYRSKKFNVSSGFEAVEDLYYKTWLHRMDFHYGGTDISGQKVVIEEKSEGQSVEATTVKIQGLTSSGYLLAIGEDKKPCELHPDGNSFDFFKGLVRRKIE